MLPLYKARKALPISLCHVEVPARCSMSQLFLPDWEFHLGKVSMNDDMGDRSPPQIVYHDGVGEQQRRPSGVFRCRPGLHCHWSTTIQYLVENRLGKCDDANGPIQLDTFEFRLGRRTFEQTT